MLPDKSAAMSLCTLGLPPSCHHLADIIVTC